jgi:hypothetical protein
MGRVPPLSPPSGSRPTADLFQDFPRSWRCSHRSWRCSLWKITKMLSPLERDRLVHNWKSTQNLKNLMLIFTFCSTSLRKHSLSLFYKYMIFKNHSIWKHLFKSTIVKKRRWISSKLINLGFKFHLHKSCFQLHIFIKIPQNPKMEFSELLKNNCFLKHIHLTVSQQYKPRKTIKACKKGGMTQWPPTASQNDPKLKKSILAYTIDKITSN